MNALRKIPGNFSRIIPNPVGLPGKEPGDEQCRNAHNIWREACEQGINTDPIGDYTAAKTEKETEAEIVES